MGEGVSELNIRIEHRDTETQRFYFEHFKKLCVFCDSVFNSLLTHPLVSSHKKESNMNEVEKMRSSQLADMSAPEIQVKFEHAKRLLAKMRVLSTYDEAYRGLLEELVPGIPADSIICPPFHCDHGDGIRLGEHVFVNANCTFLDGGYITIGDHTLIGPCVQIYTPHHPMDYLERRSEKEYAYPVTIGRDCWIGGGCIICPGVTIGDRCIIGAGSVVTKDIPSDSVAVGNPAKVIRKNEVKN